MTETTATTPLTPQEFSACCQKILSRAKQMFQANPDWVTFFRENLGAGSMARKVFKDSNDFLAFERTPEFQEVQRLVGQLRNRKISPNAVNEPTRVITVRLPESLHEALRLEAEDHDTSINKLCISKLLQVLDELPKSTKSAPANRIAQPAIANPAMANSTSNNMGNTTGHPMQPAMSAPPNFRSTYNPSSGNP